MTFIPAQLKKHDDTCTLLLYRAANTQWIRFITTLNEKWISCNNRDFSLEWCDIDQDPEPVAKRLTYGKKEMLFLLLLRRTNVLNDSQRRWNCRLHCLLQATGGNWGYSSCQSHMVRQNPAPGGQREIASCENQPAKAERPRDEAATPSTLFPRRLSVRFPSISKPGTVLPRAVLQERQGRGVRTADLDRDQTSRLPGKGIEQLTERWRVIVGTRGSTTTSQEWLKLLILAVKLKFWKTVIIYVSP